jgi:hypothetical protein
MNLDQAFIPTVNSYARAGLFKGCNSPLLLTRETLHSLRIMGYVKVWASCAWIWFCEGCLYKCLAKKGERNTVLGLRMYQKQANCGCGSKQKLASGTKSTNWVYHLCLVI